MKNEINLQTGFYFDQTRCMGCAACVIACKQWHDVPPGPASWMKIKTIEEGTFPNVYLGFLPSRCLNCENAPCVEACPAGAISKREKDGIVLVDRDKCLGRDACGSDCSDACPAGTDVRGFVSLIKKGKYEDAWRLIVESNPFPGVCGRVCVHPCESECARGQVDEPVAINALERLAAEHMSPKSLHRPYLAERQGEKVAVVGSGPAGLTCAYHLAKLGYPVTVFEALPVAGGMLRVGIPEYHLPREIVDREIAFIEGYGVEIKTNMRLGENLSKSDLDQYATVFLSMGAHKPKMLDIPGKELKGVMTGIDFLAKVNSDEKVELGKQILVIGGGDVAIDCARSALRLGATDVNIACLESYEQMPANPVGIAEAEEEGIKIHPSRSFCQILGNDGHCDGIECVNLRSMKFEQDGTLKLDVIENSEHVLPADTVIFAIGQALDTNALPDGLKVKNGRIDIDDYGATSLPNYFAGGDAAIPEWSVAYAIGSGKRAAEEINRRLRDLPVAESQSFSKTRKPQILETELFEKMERVPIKKLPPSNRVSGFPEIELTLTDEQGKKEAGRCLDCRGMCSLVCPYDVPQFDVGDNPKMQKCDSCLEEWEAGKDPICVRSCPTRALDAGPIEELKAKYGDGRAAKTFVYYEKTKPNIVLKPKTK
jgi:NADPH-dependent glutamate synthase beta subunit-like oxidoreductase